MKEPKKNTFWVLQNKKPLLFCSYLYIFSVFSCSLTGRPERSCSNISRRHLSFTLLSCGRDWAATGGLFVIYWLSGSTLVCVSAGPHDSSRRRIGGSAGPDYSLIRRVRAWIKHINSSPSIHTSRLGQRTEGLERALGPLLGGLIDRYSTA